MARLLLLLSLLAGNLTAAQPTCNPGVKGWCQEPSIGEAKNPGPGAAFDDDDAQALSEDEVEPTPIPGDSTWAPSPEDEAYGDDPLTDEQPLSLGHSSVPQRVQQWEARAAATFERLQRRSVHMGPSAARDVRPMRVADTSERAEATERTRRSQRNERCAALSLRTERETTVTWEFGMQSV